MRDSDDSQLVSLKDDYLCVVKIYAMLYMMYVAKRKAEWQSELEK